MLKMVKGMIGPAAINQAIEGIQEMAAQYIADQNPNTKEGEAGAVVFYQTDGIWIFAVMILGADNVPRFVNVQPLDKFINSIIENI